jgi:diguanylate cyclase (GGDEF)-like protein/PAS domain S-box-containing protein
MRTLDALEELARLVADDAADQVGALSEATHVVGAAIGSDDVRLIGGDGVNFEAYPPREGEDFFGLCRDGLMSMSQELRRIGRSGVYSLGDQGMPRDIASADGSAAGTYVGLPLWRGDVYLGTVVAYGPWTATAARRAGRFLELAGPPLTIMFGCVADTTQKQRVQQEMNLLADVARVFARAGSMREVLSDSVSAINGATGFLTSIDVLDSRGRITLRTTDAGRFTHTPLYDAWLKMVRAPDRIREMILKDPRPVILPDLQNDPRLSEEARQFYRRISLVSGATFPLLFRDEIVGLLRVGSLKPEPFAQPMVEMLQNLALQAAVAVKGARLREELVRSQRKTERYAASLQAKNKDLRNEISERERAEEALRASEEKYRDMIENLNEVIYSLDKEGRVTYVSPVVEQLGGYHPSEVIGRSFTEFVHPDDLAPLIESYKRTVSGHPEPSEYRMLTKSGELRWVRTSSRIVLDGDDVVGLRAVLMDITDRKRAEEQIRHLAYHDSLTNLPNRALMKDRLTVAVAQARRSRQPLAVMFLDLDRLKLVNDTVGHAVGDRLLQGVAERLIAFVREGDSVARVGGDEFTLLLPNIAGMEDALRVAERILERLREPWMLVGHEFHVSASLGISMYPGDGEDAETLLRNADTAMYRAKDRGGDAYEIFTAAMNARILERVKLEKDLRHALERKQFVVHYQPQVNIETVQIEGVEALVRWRRPNGTLVWPDEFIPLMEETGLIVTLGEWVMRAACAQNRAWQDAGLSPVRVGVNLSARQFQQPNLSQMIAKILEETGLAPGYLELEITEGTAMRDVEFTIATLTTLREMGVHVSIDDFGTGYSSLEYLKRFPIDRVKIDRSFVRDSTTDPDDAAIVAAIISLARSLKLTAVAEGVETEEQLTVLREHQCNEAQGHLFSKAVSAEAVERLLKGKRPRRLSRSRVKAGQPA